MIMMIIQKEKRRKNFEEVKINYKKPNTNETKNSLVGDASDI